LNHPLTVEEQLDTARISEVAEHCSLNETICPPLKEDVKCRPSLTEKEKNALLIHLSGNRYESNQKVYFLVFKLDKCQELQLIWSSLQNFMAI